MLAALAACASNEGTGEMTTQSYRSLDARGDSLTLEDARAKGAIDSDDLADQFVEEGGAAAPGGATCLYAETTRRDRFLGTARFCEVDGVVTPERNRLVLD